VTKISLRYRRQLASQEGFKSNMAIMQRYQSKLLRTINNAPWYVNNHTLHIDLHIPYVRTVGHNRINKHHTTLASHPTPLWNQCSNQRTTKD